MGQLLKIVNNFGVFKHQSNHYWVKTEECESKPVISSLPCPSWLHCRLMKQEPETRSSSYQGTWLPWQVPKEREMLLTWRTGLEDKSAFHHPKETGWQSEYPGHSSFVFTQLSVSIRKWKDKEAEVSVSTSGQKLPENVQVLASLQHRKLKLHIYCLYTNVPK